MSERIGRIVVAYIPEWGVVRVVHGVTGMVIREDVTGPLNKEAFKAVVTRYKKLIA